MPTLVIFPPHNFEEVGESDPIATDARGHSATSVREDTHLEDEDCNHSPNV